MMIEESKAGMLFPALLSFIDVLVLGTSCQEVQRYTVIVGQFQK